MRIDSAVRGDYRLEPLQNANCAIGVTIQAIVISIEQNTLLLRRVPLNKHWDIISCGLKNILVTKDLPANTTQIIPSLQKGSQSILSTKMFNYPMRVFIKLKWITIS